MDGSSNPPDELQVNTNVAAAPATSTDAESEGFSYLWLLPQLWAAPFHPLPGDAASRSERKSLKHALLAALAALTIVIRPVANSMTRTDNAALTLNAFVLSIVFAIVIDFLFARWPLEQREHARLMGLITLLVSVATFILVDALQTTIPVYGTLADYLGGSLQASILITVVVVSFLLGANTIRAGSMGGQAIRDIIVLVSFSGVIISIFALIDDATFTYVLKLFNSGGDGGA